MKKYLYLVASCLILSACISEQERYESMYRYEQTMRNQCEHALGFKTGTQNYMNCRMFYDEYLSAKGYDTEYMSFSKAQNIQNQIAIYFARKNERFLSPIRFVNKNDNSIYPILMNQFSREIRFAFDSNRISRLFFNIAFASSL